MYSQNCHRLRCNVQITQEPQAKNHLPKSCLIRHPMNHCQVQALQAHLILQVQARQNQKEPGVTCPFGARRILKRSTSCALIGKRKGKGGEEKEDLQNRKDNVGMKKGKDATSKKEIFSCKY